VVQEEEEEEEEEEEKGEDDEAIRVFDDATTGARVREHQQEARCTHPPLLTIKMVLIQGENPEPVHDI
jgi:hypothetical protein